MSVANLQSLFASALRYAAPQRRGLQDPCNQATLNELRSLSMEKLGAELPEEHLTLLAFADGFILNGLICYGSREATLHGTQDVIIPGVIDWNLRRYRGDLPGFEKRIVFAEDSLCYYALAVDENSYVVESWGGGRLHEYPQFSDLLRDALHAANVV
jgi:hypothetical protein